MGEELRKTDSGGGHYSRLKFSSMEKAFRLSKTKTVSVKRTVRIVRQEGKWEMEKKQLIAMVGKREREGRIRKLRRESFPNLYKLTIRYHSAVVLALCLQWHPPSSGNLSESCREDFFLTLRKIYYLFWKTKDVFRVQAFGSGDLVSNFIEFDLKGYTQWIRPVGQVNGIVHRFRLSIPVRGLWSIGWHLCQGLAFRLAPLSCFPCLIPSSAFSTNR